jgi:hypothetical protein
VLNQRFRYLATALQDLPNETVIDGELVALGPGGRPDFHLLQNLPGPGSDRGETDARLPQQVQFLWILGAFVGMLKFNQSRRPDQ